MRKVILSFSIVLLVTATLTQALTVDVFTTTVLGVRQSVMLDPLPKTAKVNVFKVDQLKQLQGGLNQRVKLSVMPGDDKRFKEIAKQWMTSHKKFYMKVTTAIQETYRDSITEVPAIVFDHKYTVLGTNDINQAYQVYLNKIGHNHV